MRRSADLPARIASKNQKSDGAELADQLRFADEGGDIVISRNHRLAAKRMTRT